MVRTSTDDGRTWSEARRLPDGDARPDQEQAGPSRRRHDRQPEQHRVERQAEPVANPLRAVDRWRQDVDDRSARRRRRRARAPGDPAEHPRPSGRQAAGGRPHAVASASSRRGPTDGGKTWTPLTLDGAAQPERRDRRRHAARWPAAHRLQPHAEGTIAAERRGVARRHGVGGGAGARERARRVFVPGRDSGRDGKVHITYTWKRQRVRHVVIDPSKLASVPMTDGLWPPQLGRARRNSQRVGRGRLTNRR